MHQAHLCLKTYTGMDWNQSFPRNIVMHIPITLIRALSFYRFFFKKPISIFTRSLTLFLWFKPRIFHLTNRRIARRKSKQFLFNYSIWLTPTINQVLSSFICVYLCYAFIAAKRRANFCTKPFFFLSVCVLFGYKAEPSLVTTRAYVYQSEFYPTDW